MECNLNFEIKQFIFVTLSRILRRTFRFSPPQYSFHTGIFTSVPSGPGGRPLIGVGLAPLYTICPPLWPGPPRPPRCEPLDWPPAPLPRWLVGSWPDSHSGGGTGLDGTGLDGTCLGGTGLGGGGAADCAFFFCIWGALGGIPFPGGGEDL